MEIIKTNLNFNSLSKRARTTYGILHHTACSTATPEDIHRWHLANGWAGAGYNLYIRKDGSIYELRPIDCVGAHAQGYNSVSVGVCFEGNFEEEEMTSEQIGSGKQIIAYLKERYPRISFKGHRDVNSTDCPGKNFKFDEIVNGQPSQVISQPTIQNPSTSTVADVQKYLNDKYNAGLEVDNIFGPKTQKALVIALQTELNKLFNRQLKIDGIFGNKTYTACVTIKQGAKNALVYILQGALICKGYQMKLDGDFGPVTEDCTAQYQRAKGLVVDALAGRNTFRSLLV